METSFWEEIGAHAPAA